MASELLGRPLVAGEAHGLGVVLPAGLSFAMGFDPVLGTVEDVHGGAAGRLVTGTILVMRSGRGSSSASTALAEAIRLGTAPAAILLAEVDGILAVGAVVARRLYGRVCPIVVLAPADLGSIGDGDPLTIAIDGRVHLDG